MFFNGEEDCARDVLMLYGLPLHDDSCWWVKYPKRAAEELYKIFENTNAAITSFSNRQIVFEEVITNNFGNQFHMSYETGSRFPFKMAKVFLQTPKVEYGKAPHLYSDGSLCLMHPSQYNSNISILQTRNLASAWCLCLDVYWRTGEWPAAEFNH